MKTKTVVIGESTQIKQDKSPACPNCNQKIDGFAGTNGATKPHQDDFSVCAKCFHLLVFNINEGGVISLDFAPLDALMINDFPVPLKAINKRVVVG